ncbi:substrate-binding domain-containing protein [Gemmobacter lanyuensis]
MSLNKFKTAALAAATTLVLGAGASFAQTQEKDWSHINILFVPWSQSSNPFFEAVVNGAKDAALQQGVNIDVQFGEEDQQHQLGILETGIANKVSAIAVNIADDNAYIDVLCKAMNEGIPVVTFNIDDSRHGAPGSTCRMAFMGQNFVDAGYVLGKRMIAEHGLKKGMSSSPRSRRRRPPMPSNVMPGCRRRWMKSGPPRKSSGRGMTMHRRSTS